MENAVESITPAAGSGTLPAGDAPGLPSTDAGLAAMPDVSTPGGEAVSLLPHDLSPWGMFLNADIVVQTVMVGLALASLLTWTVWIAKTAELRVNRRRVLRANEVLRGASTLGDVARHPIEIEGPVAALVGAAEEELQRSLGTSDDDGIKERIAMLLSRLEAGFGRRMMIGTGILATIGSVAPFVGLFGTVWGIMNAFIGIARAHTTNLAVVAPGIAEALLATALGLVAAIPAVVIYNLFTRSIGGYRASLADASAEIMRHVSRDLARSGRPRIRAAE